MAEEVESEGWKMKKKEKKAGGRRKIGERRTKEGKQRKEEKLKMTKQFV